MRRIWSAVAALLAFPLLTLSAQQSSPLPDNVTRGHDWTQFGWDDARTSVSTAPTGIDEKNVATMRRQQVTLDGTVDASAIYLSDVAVNGAPHDALFVTTTYGKTIAINANTGAILWTYTPPGYQSWTGTRQITNSTPVADPGREFIYAATPDGHVQKLAVADGHAIWSTAVTSLPDKEKIASPLSYYAGHIIAVTGGYIGDAPPYQGHVAILDAVSGKLLHVWNSLCSDRAGIITPSDCPESGSAIWGRAGAVIDSATGDIYVATGNGRWDGKTYWGDAVLRLDSSATRMLGNYTPSNSNALADADADIGSTSPALIGGGDIVQAGKDGKIRVLSGASMTGAAPHSGGELQAVPTPSGNRVFTAVAVRHGPSGMSVFVTDNDGTTAWTASSGKISPLWQNNNGGTSPVIAGGLLYIYDPRGGGLRVYVPSSGKLITALPCGSGHWNSPIVIDHMIVVPEGTSKDHSTTGILDIWRLP
jgi:outer membrane protein assembly factor BamB